MKFCGECGAALALKCRSCGFENLREMKFCGECGKSLAGAADPAVEVAKLGGDGRLDDVYAPVA